MHKHHSKIITKHIYPIFHTQCYQSNFFKTRMTFRSLLSLFVLEGLDLTLDWSLFADISTRHDLDPFLSDVCLVIMVFCVIGTLTFVLELYLKYMEISKPESDLNPDVFSAATTWLEDIPMIGLGVYVAMTLRSHLSLVLYVKAVYAIFEAVIRLGTLYCRGNRSGNWTQCLFFSQLFCFFAIVSCSMTILSVIVL